MNKGEMQKVKFGLFKKTFMFECEDHGLVLERDGKTVCLYATDRNHAKIYCALPLGPEKIFKRLSYMIVAPDDQYMLMLVEGVMVVVDFVNKTCATNVEKLHVFGSDAWGEECSAPWQKEYNKLFGLEMNAAAADAFWNWFAENEESIVSRLNGINSGGQGAAVLGWFTDRRGIDKRSIKTDIRQKRWHRYSINQSMWSQWETNPLVSTMVNFFCFCIFLWLKLQI